MGNLSESFPCWFLLYNYCFQNVCCQLKLFFWGLQPLLLISTFISSHSKTKLTILPQNLLCCHAPCLTKIVLPFIPATLVGNLGVILDITFTVIFHIYSATTCKFYLLHISIICLLLCPPTTNFSCLGIWKSFRTYISAPLQSNLDSAGQSYLKHKFDDSLFPW